MLLLSLLALLQSAPARCKGPDGRMILCRSSTQRHRFEVATGHPHGWKGHVVDHIIPLECGGPDAPQNMRWQTTAAGKQKDKWERDCHRDSVYARSHPSPVAPKR